MHAALPFLRGIMQKALSNLEEILCVLLLSLMSLLAFANVIFRYAFHMPLAFTEELTTGMLVLLTFVGAGIAAKRGSHLGLSLLTDFLSPPLQRAAAFIGAVLAVIFCGVIAYYGIGFTQHAYLGGQLSGGMQWPEWIYNSYVPIGAALLTLRFLLIAVGILQAKGKG